MTFANRPEAAKHLPVLSAEVSQPSSFRCGLKPVFTSTRRVCGRAITHLRYSGCHSAWEFSSDSQRYSRFSRSAEAHWGNYSHPSLMFRSEGIAFLLLCAATPTMGKIEHRKFGVYGLPLHLAPRREVSLILTDNGLLGKRFTDK
jgi:hypothetical protein